MRPALTIDDKRYGGGELFVIAGPCVLEHRALTMHIAGTLRDLAFERGIGLIFKASYDKANRTSLGAGRGVGIEHGLAMLAEVREHFRIPVLTDVHGAEQCAAVAEVVDVLQIPAFLCRQTDLVVAAAETGKVVNIKKGQFLAPWDMQHLVRKVTASGNPRVMITERGVSFGYGRLVVDMTGFDELSRCEVPVVFDATHSVQQPGQGGKTGGDRRLVPALARAAAATGQVDGMFFEVHPDPDASPSDAANMVRLEEFPAILDGVLAVHRAARAQGSASSQASTSSGSKPKGPVSPL